MANFSGFTKMISNIPYGKIASLARQANSYMAPMYGKMAVGALAGYTAASITGANAGAGAVLGAIGGLGYGRGIGRAGMTGYLNNIGEGIRPGVMGGLRSIRGEAVRGWGNAGVDALRARQASMFSGIAPQAARGADWMFRPRPMV